MGFLLQRRQLGEFLALLSKDGSLVAPLRRKADGVVAFEEVRDKKDLSRLDLTANPQFTAKKYFMPAYEELFEYDMQEQELTDRKLKKKARVLFGLRLCDLNAVRIQDALFLGKQYQDDHYRAARESVVLVGWYCNSPPSPFCFCESMKLTNYYDLMLKENNDGTIYIDVGTEKGKALLNKVKSLKLQESGGADGANDAGNAIPPIKTAKHLDTHDIRRFFERPEWQRTTEEECLSCQRCTTMCPTCMCFNIYDETRLDLRHGVRKRSWDSCHALDFTRVAGGHVFRPDRTARFKHRVYHKITYYPETFGSPMCTGCGRCIEQCPAQIDFVRIINEMNVQR